MPSTTANRAYPYPVAGDAVDIPGDMQRLASAIDTDVKAVKATADSASAVVSTMGFKYVERGYKDIAPSGSNVYSYQIAFSRTYSDPPSVMVSRTDSLPSGSTKWALTASKITTTGFQLVVYTVDGSNTAPSSPITAAWQVIGQ